MGLGKELTAEEKTKIEAWKAENVSNADIARRLGNKSTSTITKYLQRKKTGIKARTGRPSKVTEMDRKAIIRVASENTVSLKGIIDKLQLTIRKTKVSSILKESGIIKRRKHQNPA